VVDTGSAALWIEWSRLWNPTSETALMQTKNITPPAKTRASLHLSGFD